jgi:hypothetical protein
MMNSIYGLMIERKVSHLIYFITQSFGFSCPPVSQLYHNWTVEAGRGASHTLN